MPPDGFVISELLIAAENGVSISETFPATGYSISNAIKFTFCKQLFAII